MRGCQPSTGSRPESSAKKSTSCSFRLNPISLAPAQLCSLNSIARPIPAQGLLHVASQLTPQAGNSVFFNCQRVCAVASRNDSASGALSPEEEEAYEQFKAQREAERKAWKLEVRRRAKFDPMVTPAPGKPTPASQPPTGTNAPLPAAALPLQALSRPKAPPAATAPTPPPSRLPRPSSLSSNSGPASPGSSSRLIDLAAARSAQQQAADASTMNADTDGFMNNRDNTDYDDDDDDDDGELDVGGLAAMARKVLEDDDEEAAAAVLPVAPGSISLRRKVQPVAAVAGARRPVVAPTRKRHLVPIAQLQRAAAAAEMEQAEESGVKGKDGEEELDWNALQAYEKYEQYITEVAEEQERAARVAARRAASTSSSSPSPAKHNTTQSAITAADASPLAVRRSRQPTAPTAKTAAPLDSTDSVDKLDRQLDQWEQMIKLFEIVERDGKRQQAHKQTLAKEAEAKEPRGNRKGRKQGGGKPSPAASSSATMTVGGSSLAAGLEGLGLSYSGGNALEEEEDALGEVEMDWQSLERLLLGEGWDAELEELRAKVDSANQLGAEVGNGEEEEAEESWRDEVSTLLLGLVEISAKRYLGRSLLTGPPTTSTTAKTVAMVVGEDERAAVFWEAPFILLVQDDSADPLLEYANRAALSALQIESFDEATGGLSASRLVDPGHPRSQQDWLWACTEAAERPKRFATIPSLRLRGPNPRSPAVLATDVTVFRVDSLEEQSIGQAVLIGGWRQLRPEEEGEGHGGEEPLNAAW